jgi:hypothetical protein
MKIAIMQPYFLPYIGYWQLINAVYDNIQYTKKGWFNRNRFLQNGEDVLFTIPLKKDSDYLDVKDRYISSDFSKDKLINQLKGAYSKAPHSAQVLPIIEEILNYDNDNLFEYILNSIKRVCLYLDIETKIIISSEVSINHSLKAENKVIAICKAEDASTYINPIGGVELYDKEEFKSNEIDLKFLKSNNVEYQQFDHQFVPWLSIADVMMFNDKEEIKKFLESYELV